MRPGSPTFSESNQKDIRKRQKGPNQNPKITPAEPKKFLGITNFGFSKKNEVFVGRTAQLGFLASVIGEKVCIAAMELLGVQCCNNVRSLPRVHVAHEHLILHQHEAVLLCCICILYCICTIALLLLHYWHGLQTKLHTAYITSELLCIFCYISSFRQSYMTSCVSSVQVTGKGPLAQVGVATGVPISQVSIGLIAFIAFFLVAAVFEGNYGEENKEDYSQY